MASPNKPYPRRQRYSDVSNPGTVWDPDDKMGPGTGSGTGSIGPEHRTVVFQCSSTIRIGTVGSPTRIGAGGTIKRVGASLGLKSYGNLEYNVYKCTPASYDSGTPTWTSLLASNGIITELGTVNEAVLADYAVASGDYLKAEVLVAPTSAAQLSITLDLGVN